MTATILNTEVAINASVQVVRAFVQLRQCALNHGELARKIFELEKKYDSQFKAIFDAIRQLMMPPARPQRRIGF